MSDNLKNMIRGLYETENPEKAKRLNDSILDNIITTYNGDYQTIVKELYKNENPEKYKRINDNVLSNIGKAYGFDTIPTESKRDTTVFGNPSMYGMGASQIKSKTDVKDESQWKGTGEELKEQGKAGVNQLVAGMYGVPGFIYDFVGSGLRALGIPVPKYDESLLTKDLTVGKRDWNPLSILDKDKNYLLEFAKQNAYKVKELNPDIERGFWEPVTKGEYSQGFRNLFSGITQSAPASAAMMLSSGLTVPAQIGAGAAVFGSMNVNEADQKNDYGNISRDGVLAVSAITGALESIFETTFGSGAAGKAISNVIKTKGKQEASEHIKKGFGNAISDMITKNPWMAPFGEAYEEIGTQLTQNIVNKYSGYQPEIKITDNLIDAGFMGLGMGAIHGGLIGGLKSVVSNNKTNKPEQPTELQPAEPVTPEPPQPPDPRKEYETNISTWFDNAKHESGNLITVNHRDYGPVRIVQGGIDPKTGEITDPDGTVMIDTPEGIRPMTKIDMVDTPIVVPKEQYLQNVLSKYDLDLSRKDLALQQSFEIDGQRWIETGESDQDTKQPVIEMLDDELRPSGQRKAITPEELAQYTQKKEVIQEAEQKGGPVPEIKKATWGKNEYQYKKNEDGTADVILPPKSNLKIALNEIQKHFENNQKFEAVPVEEEKVIPPADDFSEPTIQKVATGIRIQPRTAQEMPLQAGEAKGQKQSQPKYTIGKEEATRGEIEEMISLSDTYDQLKDVKIENDQELTAKLQEKFKPSYLIDEQPATADQVRARIRLGKDIDKIKVENDAVLGNFLKEARKKLPKFENEKPVNTDVSGNKQDELFPNNETSDDLLNAEIEKRRSADPDYDNKMINQFLDELKSYNSMTRAQKNRYNINGLMKRINAHGLYATSIRGGDGQFIMKDKDGTSINYKRELLSAQEERENRTILQEYEPETQEKANMLINLPETAWKLINLPVPMNVTSINAAIRDVREGKKTKAANNLLDNIDKMLETGIVPFKPHMGQQMPDMTLDEVIQFYSEEQTPEDIAQAENIPDDVVDAILEGKSLTDEQYEALNNFDQELAGSYEVIPEEEEAEPWQISREEFDERTANGEDLIGWHGSEAEKQASELVAEADKLSKSPDKKDKNNAQELYNAANAIGDHWSKENSHENQVRKAYREGKQVSEFNLKEYGLTNIEDEERRITEVDQQGKEAPGIQNIEGEGRPDTEAEKQAKIKDKFEKDFDNSLQGARRLLQSINDQIDAKKKEFEQRAKNAQKELFPKPGLKQGEIETPIDLSKENYDRIMKPLLDEKAQLEKDIDNSLTNQEQIINRNREEYLKARKAQGNLFEGQVEEVNPNPSEAQKKAGNYKKGHVKVEGMDISIENPAGSTRSGTDAKGNKWENTLNHHYGYFVRTEGKDGDQIDTFINPETPETGKVFVVDQNNPDTGEFDESKVMLGFNTPEEAKQAYLSNYEKEWKGLRAITEVSPEDFKTWLYDGARQRKPFAEYKDTPEPVKYREEVVQRSLDKYIQDVANGKSPETLIKALNDNLETARRNDIQQNIHDIEELLNRIQNIPAQKQPEANLLDRINKLSPYENQGFQVDKLRSLKENMLNDPEKANEAFKIMDFAGKLWHMENEFTKKPLASVMQFHPDYGEANNLQEFIENQKKVYEKNLQDYQTALRNAKTEKDKAWHQEGVNRANEDLKRLNDLINESGLLPDAGVKQPWEMTNKEFYDYFGEDDVIGDPVRRNWDNADKRWNELPDTSGLVKASEIIPLLDKAKDKKRAIYHYSFVRQALSEGKNVPAEVLNDYPDLIPKKTEREAWEETREDYVGQGYRFSQTDRALQMELNKWKKIRSEASKENVNIEAVEKAIASVEQKIKLANEHRKSIEQAIAEGKPVPEEVLQDYPELGKQEPKEPGKEYRYKMLLRPFDIGTYPKEGFVKADNDPEGGFQILTYNRKLPAKDWKHYSFYPITEIEEIKGKKFIDKDGEYGSIDIDWGKNQWANVTITDKEGNILLDRSSMNVNEILQNVEEGYWKEKPAEQVENKTPLEKKIEQPKEINYPDDWKSTLMKTRYVANQVFSTEELKKMKDEDTIDWGDRDWIIRAIEKKLGTQQAQKQPQNPVENKTPLEKKLDENKLTSIGQNNEGITVFKDGNGVRSIVKNGIRRTQKIRIIPGRGIEYSDAEQLYNEGEYNYLTNQEYNEFESKNKKSEDQKPQYTFDRIHRPSRFIPGIGYETQVTYKEGSDSKSTFTFYSNKPVTDFPKSFKNRDAVDEYKRNIDGGAEEYTPPEQPIKPTPQPPEYGAGNKLVSKDRYEELKRKMKDKLNNLNAGFDPELLAMGTEMAMFHIEAGARKFADFSRRMITDLGDAIKPYLKAIYNGAADMPGMEELSEQMDDPATVKGIDVNAIKEEEQQEEVVPEKPTNKKEYTKTTPIVVKKHTKTGETLYTTNLVDRVDRDEYTRINKIAKKYNGGYSSFLKAFMFTSEEGANKFRDELEPAKKTGTLSDLTKDRGALIKTPQERFIENIKDRLETAQKIKNTPDLVTTALYSGMVQGNQYKDVKELYDIASLALNQYIAESGETFSPVNKSAQEAKEIVKKLNELQDILPTETQRSATQVELQQYSTPPAFAFLTNWAAEINSDDRVLEPSAGEGNIAVFAKAAGAKVYVNEWDKNRASLLKRIGFENVTQEDAKHLHAVNSLKDDPITVVVMNPPFSKDVAMGAKMDLHAAEKHIDAALMKLEDGGRLVAIVGRGMSFDSPTHSEWWNKIRSQYNVKANIFVSGDAYRAKGTTFDNRILIIDKDGRTDDNNIVKNSVNSYDELIDILQQVPQKPRILYSKYNENERNNQNSEGVANPTKRPGERDANTPTANAGGVQRGNAGRSGTKPIRQGGNETGNNQPGTLFGQPSTPVAGTSTPGKGGGRSQNAPGGQNRGTTPGNANNGSALRGNEGKPGRLPDTNPVQPSGTVPGGGLSVTRVPKQSKSGNIGYDEYNTELLVDGAKEHPTKLVESSAMASVSLPEVNYNPRLSKEVVDNGVLSKAQLEDVVLAGNAHRQVLPNGDRRGFFLGAGTGYGKGRTIAGIILDNINQGNGKGKAVWISKNDKAHRDSPSYWQVVGGNPKMMFTAKNAQMPIKQDNGVLMMTYGTLRSSYKPEGRSRNEEIPDNFWTEKHNNRVQQIAQWLGKDFDGVIVFDESHEMAKGAAVKVTMGTKQPSLQALAGIELQRLVPKARIVYSSATGATEVSNLRYAQRLGLWGDGTPFDSPLNFEAAVVNAGVAGMEIISKDLKAMGLYTAKTLSYDGVEYDTLTHNLMPDQKDLYDHVAGAWRIVLENINEAIEDNNTDRMAKSAALSAFWGAHQRFFSQIITTMEMPTLLTDVQKQLDAGKSVVIQMVSTNEAQQRRALAEGRKDNEEEIDYDELDLSPKSTLIELIRKSFPVAQFQEITDENGNTVKVLVRDADGNIVLNPESVRKRDALISRLSAELTLPESPIDMILNTFGVDNVAEVTGRSNRIVKKLNEDNRLVKQEESRTDKHTAKDTNDFMDGKKRILIFSKAGGTGASFHSDLSRQNQQQRVHYVLQAGWQADAAIQGFGRSHRSNQAVAPIFKLVTTDLKAQMRFLSSIARRLEQLGALTKGQRDTGGQGILDGSYNLESRYAKQALYQFYYDVENRRISDIPMSVIEEQMFLKPYREDESGMREPDPNIIMDTTKFLNRIMSLDVDIMDRVFDEFINRLNEEIRVSVDAGTYDAGIENVNAENIKVVDEQVINTDEKTKGKTYLTTFEVELKNNKRDWNTINKEVAKYGDRFRGFFQEKKSERVYAIVEQRLMNSDGSRSTRIERRSVIADAQVDNVDLYQKYQKINNETAKELWAKEFEEYPETRKRTDTIVKGLILPIWNRLPETINVRRYIDETGIPHLGRYFNSNDIRKINKHFKVSNVNKYTPEQIKEIIQKGGDIEYSNSFKFWKTTHNGMPVVKILNASPYTDRDRLERAGAYFVVESSFTMRGSFYITMENLTDAIPKIEQLYNISIINAEDSDGNFIQAGRSPMFRLTSKEGFYSTVEDALNKITQQKGTPEQFKAMLLKNGAKQAEMDWMDFDNTFTGKSVTKQEVQDWIDQNRIELKEVVKGNEETPDEWEVILDNGAIFNINIDHQDYDGARQLAEQEAYDRYGANILVDRLNKISHESKDETKYSQYVTQGGSNYKELLLTMPDTKQLTGIKKISDSEWAYTDPNGYTEYYYTEESAKQAANKKQYKEQFKAPHWDEPNILAHIRANEYKSNGERVLVIQEIQSDWAQKGKKEGFKFDEGWDIKEIKKQPNGLFQPIFNNGEMLTAFDTEEQAINRAEGYSNSRKQSTVPDMPFKKTDQWVNLALRRMMRYAAENGFDRIAWTTGEQQAARYDLSKQVESITYTPDKKETYPGIVRAYPKGGNEVPIVKKVQNANELSEIVGNEITEKINNGERDIRGIGLKVGGEGMKAFYDQIIPAAASKLGKPFGAKVENTEIIIDNKYDKKAKLGEWGYWEVDIPGVFGDWTEEGATNIIKERLEDDGIKDYYIYNEDDILRVETSMTVQSLPVTDSMEESVMQGIPLFKQEGSILKTASNEKIVSKINEIQAKATNARPVVIAENEQQLTEKLNEFKVGQRNINRIVKHFNTKNVSGFYDPVSKIVVINPNNINSEADAVAAWLHEMGIHAGLENIIPKEQFNELMESVYDFFTEEAKTDPEFRKIFDKVNESETYSEGTKAEKGEEMLAYLAETRKNEGNLFKHKSLWSRLMENIRKLLAKVFGQKNIPLTKKEIENIIDASIQSNYNQTKKPGENTPGRKNILENVTPLENKISDLSKWKYDTEYKKYPTFSALGYDEQTDKPIMSRDVTPLEAATERYAQKALIKRTNKEIRDGMVEFWKDVDLPLKRFEQWIEVNGGKIDDNSQPYRQISLAKGRMESLFDDFQNTLVEPLNKAVASIIKSGTKGDFILPYVIAKHTLERNPDLRQKEIDQWIKYNEDASQEDIDAFIESVKDKDYSGIMPLDIDKETGKSINGFTNPEELAQSIVDEFESKVDDKLVSDLWKSIHNLGQSTLKVWLNGNSMSQEEYDNQSKRYKYFVPLRGWREGDATQLAYRRGEGFSKSLIHAEGRGSIAENPFAYFERVHFQALAEQVENEVCHEMLNLVSNNYKLKGLKDIAVLKTAYYVKYVLPDGTEEWDLARDVSGELMIPPKEMFETGEAKAKVYGKHMRLRSTAQAREHEVIIKGKNSDFVLVFPHKHLEIAYALRNQNTMYRDMFTGKYENADFWNKSGPIVKMAIANNLLKAMYTSYNIVFPITNLSRDIQEGILTQWIKGESGKAVLKNYSNSFPAIMRYMRGKSDVSNKYDQLFERFRHAGGPTGFTHLKRVEEIEKEINRKVSDIVNKKKFKGSFGRNRRALVHSIEAWNRLFEDATRFSVFVSAVESGKTDKEAASMAKEATLNFNRKGKITKAFDSLYAFFNVALEGSYKNFGLGKKYPKRFFMAAAGYMAAGFIMALLNDMSGGDDDDYYNVSEYARHNYLLIPNIFKLIKEGDAGDKYFRLPLSQFWRGFYSLGSIGYDVLRGTLKGEDKKLEISPSKAIGTALSNFMTGLLPVDINGLFAEGGPSLSPIAPTILKPFVEIIENRNFLQESIYKEPFTLNQKKVLAQSGLGKDNVNAGIKFFTDILYKWGGGETNTYLKYRIEGDNKPAHEVPWYFDWNPSKLEHILKGYTGGTGGVITDAVTSALQIASPKQELDFKNIPFINAFIRKTPEAKWKIIREYYDNKAEVLPYGDVMRAYKKDALITGDATQYKEAMGNKYLMRYNNLVKIYDAIIDDQSEYVNYQTSEGTEKVIETMKDANEAFKELRKEFKK